MKWTSLLIVTTLLFHLCPMPCESQGLRPGVRVRVKTSQGAKMRIEGTFVGMGEDSLTVAVNGDESLKLFKVKRGDKTNKLKVAIIGWLTVVTLGYAALRGPRGEEPSDLAGFSVAALGIALGTVLGAKIRTQRLEGVAVSPYRLTIRKNRVGELLLAASIDF